MHHKPQELFRTILATKKQYMDTPWASLKLETLVFFRPGDEPIPVLFLFTPPVKIQPLKPPEVGARELEANETVGKTMKGLSHVKWLVIRNSDGSFLMFFVSRFFFSLFFRVARQAAPWYHG